MNRQTILASVHRQLRESLAKTGQVRPLGEIVPLVAAEIRRNDPPATGGGDVRVIPIEWVAAFVDGDLDPAEVETICDAVMIDNSVLAEIIAAVRATQQPIDELPPLSPSLSAQLLAMQQVSAIDQPAEDPATPQPALNVETAIRSTRTLPPPPPNHLATAAIVVAIAATILAAIFVLGRRDQPGQDQPLIVERRPDQSVQPDAPDVVSDPAPALAEPPVTTPPSDRLAASAPEDATGAPSQELDETTPTPNDVSPNDVSPGNVESPPAVVAAEPEGAPMIASNATDEPMPESIPDRQPQQVRIADSSRSVAAVRWTQVTGLLAQQNVGSATSGSRRGPTWRRIQEGSPSTAPPRGPVALQTLPFSRASGQFAGGGKVVVSGDTGLQIDRSVSEKSAEIDLMYGSMAMVDFSPGAVVKFRHGTETLAVLRWQNKASAVVQRLTDGLQIQVDGGEIKINETGVRGRSVQVANNHIEPVRAPKRLPRWVTRAEDTTAPERMILAQIADTDDLAASLNRTIVSLASAPTLRRDDAQLLTKLANWQAAMAGSQVFRLAGHRVPAVRLAALQRLTQLSEGDPRYQRIWNAIDRATNNPQRTAQMRTWFRLRRTGARPNAAQLEQMLGGLAARDFARRAMSDFMLRQYVRNPPPFDPSWTGQQLQRAVRAYREQVGLPVDRLRQNATTPNART